jgi:hypothetical protein
MKDYIQQIMAILISNLKTDDLSSLDKNKISGISGISSAAKAINTLINNEVYGLEQQIVDLTEQLSETDSLLIEAKRAMTPRPRSRTRVAKMRRAVKQG